MFHRKMSVSFLYYPFYLPVELVWHLSAGTKSNHLSLPLSIGLINPRCRNTFPHQLDQRFRNTVLEKFKSHISLATLGVHLQHLCLQAVQQVPVHVQHVTPRRCPLPPPRRPPRWSCCPAGRPPGRWGGGRPLSGSSRC